MTVDLEDGFAADVNGLAFIFAGWGYGDWELKAVPAHWQRAMEPGRLGELLMH